jgi:hypothetical protein
VARAKKARIAKKVPKKRRARSWAKRRTTFGSIVATERQRLQKLRESALARKAEIDAELAEIDSELNAMDVFLSAKRGKSERTRIRKTRARRGEKRQQLLELIKSAPEGLTRGEIIRKLNAAEKSAQQSISNALSSLFKQKALARKDRKYLAA